MYSECNRKPLMKLYIFQKVIHQVKRDWQLFKKTFSVQAKTINYFQIIFSVHFSAPVN